MKNKFMKWAGVALVGLFLSIGNANAQLAVGVQGGVFKSTADNAKSYPGGGINFKYFVNDNVALGVAGRIYSERLNYDFSGGPTRFVNNITPVTLTADFLLTDGFVRPYLGADAGVYFQNFRVNQNENQLIKTSASNFGLAPRGGILFDFGRVGLNAEFAYHAIFGNQNNSLRVSDAGVNIDHVNNFWGANVGLVFELGR
ncbi:outer membrane beta-barrel protein [Telluribacter humicola]|uniref:outer membrane beta-barrel protein n=1 Tax=Telluribacter humicola TaxID=1720261 RepID=UPI001A9669D7|nr:OmpW family outer membrane protein [Telluribacter humicola]